MEIQEAGMKRKLTTMSAGSLYSTPLRWHPAGPMTQVHPGNLSLYLCYTNSDSATINCTLTLM